MKDCVAINPYDGDVIVAHGIIGHKSQGLDNFFVADLDRSPSTGSRKKFGFTEGMFLYHAISWKRS